MQRKIRAGAAATAGLTAMASLAMMAASCDSPVDPNAWVVVRTSAVAVELPARDPATVRFVTTNAGRKTVFLEYCGDALTIVVDRLQDGRWVNYSSGFCLDANTSWPGRLEPGQSREDVTTIGARGTYRLRLGVQRQPGQQASWDASSNAFDIR